MFHQDEIIGRQVCIELDSGDVITGLFDSTTGNYFVLRGEKGDPMLVHERFVRTVFLKPEEE